MTGRAIAAHNTEAAIVLKRYREVLLALSMAVGKLIVAADGQLREERSAALKAMERAADLLGCTRCEGCGAPLYPDDDYVSDEHGVDGCWPMFSDGPEAVGKPCYAERVGKPSAALKAGA
jgi:hypothetical protein